MTAVRANLERQALLLAFLIAWSEQFSAERAKRVIKRAAAAQVTAALELIAPTQLGGRSGALMQGYTTIIGTAAGVSSGFYTAANLAATGAQKAQKIRDQGQVILSSFRNVVDGGNLRSQLYEEPPTVE